MDNKELKTVELYTLSLEYMLALAIWREARGEPLLGKLYIAAVIRNRVLDARWPDTYEEVILQPKQFSAFNAGDPNVVKFPAGADPEWNDSMAAARFILATSSVDRITPANHYHATGILPYWAKGKTALLTVGRHVFYRL